MEFQVSNLKNGQAVADIQAVFFMKHVAGAEPVMMDVLESTDWFPVLTLRGTVNAGQDAPSIEKILVDQFDAPIGITTEPGDFNFECQMPSFKKNQLIKWLEDDMNLEVDTDGNPLTIDGREIIGVNLFGKLYEVSVLIKTRTGATIIFSNAQVSLAFTKEDKVFVWRLSGQVLAPSNEANHMLYIATEAPVAVTGLTADSTASVAVGSTVQLNYAIAPANASNQRVTFVSDTPAKAEVNENGVVTGKATGTANITITSKADPTKTATVVVTVSAAQGA